MIILGTFLFGTASCASNSAMEIFKSFDKFQKTVAPISTFLGTTTEVNVKTWN